MKKEEPHVRWTSHRPHHRPAGGHRRRRSSPCARRGARSCRTPSGPSTTGWSPTPAAAPTPRRSCGSARSGTPSSSSSRCRAESKARYSAAWEEVQIQFVDNPGQAVTTADDLVTRADRRARLPDRRLRRPARQPVRRPRAHAGPLPRRARDQQAQHRTARPAPRTCARRWCTTGRCSPTCSARTRCRASTIDPPHRPMPAQTDIDADDQAGRRGQPRRHPALRSPDHAFLLQRHKERATTSRTSTSRTAPKT